MSLQRILDAESVVIVGASKDVTKRGYQAVKTLLSDKYEGRIYLVNPRGGSVLGRTCYKSVLEIDDYKATAKKPICDLLLAVSKIAAAYPQIQEMDLNPVLATEDGVVVADARILVKNAAEAVLM